MGTARGFVAGRLGARAIALVIASLATSFGTSMIALGSAAVFAACSSPPLPDNYGTKNKQQSPRESDPVVVQKADAGSADASSECALTPPNNRCGLVQQCGCAANETCDVTNRTTGATSCVTAGGGTLGRPCVQTGDCIEGLTCQYGACRPYCATPLTKCGVAGTELCVGMTDEQQKPLPNVTFCTINCDPREPAGVCGTNACHWFATYYAPNKVSDCNFGGPKKEQEACETDGDCMPGYACIDHPQYGPECERWCRFDAAGKPVPGDCTAKDTKCVDVFGANAPVINGQKEGVCQD